MNLIRIPDRGEIREQTGVWFPGSVANASTACSLTRGAVKDH